MYIPMYAIFKLSSIIINQYFSDFWCSVIITEGYDFDTIVNRPIINYKYTPEHVEQLSEFLFEVMELGCHGFFVQMSNMSVFFEQFDANIRKINHRCGKKRVIVLPFGYGENQKENNKMANMYESKAISHIPDIIFLKPVISNHDCTQINGNVYYKFDNPSENLCFDIEINTQQYVGKVNNSKPIFLDRWFTSNCSFERGVDLFPDKMADLKGKPLRVSTFNYKPSSMWWIDDKNTLHLDGTEMRVVIEYCRWVNCTIELVHYEEDLEWGELFANNTGIGMLGNVYHDRADIGFASTCMWFHEYTFLDLSAPSVRTGITVITPKPKLVEDFLVPYLPFTLDVWIANIVVIFLSTNLLHFFVVDLLRNKKSNILIEIENTCSVKVTHRVNGKKRYNGSMKNKVKQSTINQLTESLLSILNIVLLQGGGYGGGNRGLALRNIMLFYSLFITNAYICGLTSTMTMPRYTETIDSVPQLAKSNMKWGATHDAWIFSIREATAKHLVKVRYNFINLPPKQLKKFWDDDKFAYAIERLQNGHFAIADYITEEAMNNRRLMGEDIYWDWYVAFFRKSSPFRPLYDKLVNRLHQGGLPRAWETQVVGKYLNNRIQQGVALSRSRPTNTPTVLQVHHVQGLLLLWAGLVTVSIVAFICELIIYQIRSTKQKF